MSWLREVVVDIIATIVIILSVLFSSPVLFYIVWGYTALLLIIKIITITSDNFLNLMDKSDTAAPAWFSHLLYAMNTGVLLLFHWWYAGLCWAIIWILSYYTQMQLNKRKA